MKTKFKKNGRRLLAAILCLVMAVMALPMSAFAWTSEEGVSCTSSFGDYYVGSDGGYYRSKSSYSFIVYDSDGNTSVRTISAGNAKRKYLMTDSSGTHQVYCVESGIDFNTGNSYVSQNGKNSSYFRKLPKDNIDVYLNLLPMKWSYTVAKASKKAVASEWNISEASLPMSVSKPLSSGKGME